MGPQQSIDRCDEHQNAECKTRPDQEGRRIFWARRLRSGSTICPRSAERARGNGSDGANHQDRIIRVDDSQERQRHKAARRSTQQVDAVHQTYSLGAAGQRKTDRHAQQNVR